MQIICGVYSLCFPFLDANLPQRGGELCRGRTRPSMSYSPSVPLTLYGSLAPNQMLTSLALFSPLIGRQRHRGSQTGTCSLTHPVHTPPPFNAHTHAHAHAAVLTLNNERPVTSDQCLCRCMAWWSAGGRMGATAGG